MRDRAARYTAAHDSDSQSGQRRHQVSTDGIEHGNGTIMELSVTTTPSPIAHDGLVEHLSEVAVGVPVGLKR